MPRPRVRTGGKTYVLYIDVRLFAILKRVAKSKKCSINTLVTSELAKKYSEESDLWLADEEVIEGALHKAETKEEIEVAQYKAPGPHRILFKSRVLEIENWIAGQGVVDHESAVQYAMKRWGVGRPQALNYVGEVVKDFQRLGRVYGQNPNERKYGWFQRMRRALAHDARSPLAELGDASSML